MKLSGGAAAQAALVFQKFQNRVRIAFAAWHSGVKSLEISKGYVMYLKHSNLKNCAVTTAKACQLLGCSTTWLQARNREGWIPKQSHGRFRLVDVLRGTLAYYEHLAECHKGNEKALRATEARTREIEAKIVERARQHVPKEDYLEVMSVLLEIALKQLPSLEKKVAKLIGDPLRAREQIETVRSAIIAEHDRSLQRLALS